MANRIQVSVDDMMPAIERHTAKFPAVVKVALTRVLLEGVRYVTKQKLSYSREGPQHPDGLRVQTGSARRSVAQDVAVSTNQDKVVGRFGSPLRYVRAHELGFSGSVQVPAHTRRLVALVRSAKTGTVTKKSAKAYKAARVSGRKTTAFVRAHSRQVNMEARRFFAATLKEIGPRVPPHIRNALRQLAATGNVPSVGEL